MLWAFILMAVATPMEVSLRQLPCVGLFRRAPDLHRDLIRIGHVCVSGRRNKFGLAACLQSHGVGGGCVGQGELVNSVRFELNGTAQINLLTFTISKCQIKVSAGTELPATAFLIWSDTSIIGQWGLFIMIPGSAALRHRRPRHC